MGDIEKIMVGQCYVRLAPPSAKITPRMTPNKKANGLAALQFPSKLPRGERCSDVKRGGSPSPKAFENKKMTHMPSQEILLDKDEQ